MWQVALLLSFACAASAAAPLAQAVSAGGPTYATPGSYLYTVPPGVAQVSFEVYGAAGGGTCPANCGPLTGLGGGGGDTYDFATGFCDGGGGSGGYIAPAALQSSVSTGVRAGSGQVVITATYIVAFDSNGAAEVLTDGLLILRYMFGLRGAALIAGAVDPLGSRTSAQDIEAHLASLMP